jgi:hypothetical protein
MIVQILNGAGAGLTFPRDAGTVSAEKKKSVAAAAAVGPYVCTSSAACIASHMFYAPQKALIVSFRVISTPPQLTEVPADAFRGTIF